MAAGQFCRVNFRRRHNQPATLVDFRGSNLLDAGSIPAISTINCNGASAVAVAFNNQILILFFNVHMLQSFQVFTHSSRREKMKTFRPFGLIAIFILVIGLACSINLGGPATEAPTQPPVATDAPVQQLPTDVPTVVPATEPPTAEPPTDIPATAVPANPFFTDEFDSGDLSAWTQFYLKGSDNADESKGSATVVNGVLNFKLDSVDLYSYLIFDTNLYSDVRVEVSATNRGKNNNNVSLICRYSDAGWYEFSIANNGLYWIYAYDSLGVVNKGYNQLTNGGSTKIKQGKDTNIYAITCNGDKLTLYINGNEAAKFTDRSFKLPQGKVGMNVSSFNVTPILVDIEYFKIEQP